MPYVQDILHYIQESEDFGSSS